jgi:hypothetical protein
LLFEVERPERLNGSKGAGFAGEAIEDGLAGWDFDETKDGQGENNQDDVGEPGIQSGEVEALGNAVDVEELKDVEVQKIEAVAALADEKEGAPGEDRRDGVGTAEAQDKSGEDRGHESAVHEEVWRAVDESVEEEADRGEAKRGEEKALAFGEGEGVLELAEGDSGEKGADVWERRVFEEAEKLGGAVAVDGAGDVVGVEIQVERVRDEADDPEGEKEKDELQGLLRPGQANHPREGEIEDALAGEGPGDGIPEGCDGRAPALQDEGCEDESLPKLGMRAGLPLVLHHPQRDEENEEIDGIETGEAREPELTFIEISAPVGIVVGEDIAGDEEEDADEDVSVVDEGV